MAETIFDNAIMMKMQYYRYINWQSYTLPAFTIYTAVGDFRVRGCAN